jgi:hypothetical protein
MSCLIGVGSAERQERVFMGADCCRDFPIGKKVSQRTEKVPNSKFQSLKLQISFIFLVFLEFGFGAYGVGHSGQTVVTWAGCDLWLRQDTAMI